jgi:hypothetical protein
MPMRIRTAKPAIIPGRRARRLRNAWTVTQRTPRSPPIRPFTTIAGIVIGISRRRARRRARPPVRSVILRSKFGFKPEGYKAIRGQMGRSSSGPFVFCAMVPFSSIPLKRPVPSSSPDEKAQLPSRYHGKIFVFTAFFDKMSIPMLGSFP